MPPAGQREGVGSRMGLPSRNNNPFALLTGVNRRKNVITGGRRQVRCSSMLPPVLTVVVGQHHDVVVYVSTLQHGHPTQYLKGREVLLRLSVQVQD
ncbi:MAG: hypothetical protein LBQ54_05815 [Planctomycetaceae bacterium]|nr:hypothetical protein [Planctomycetaceae bacterium]